MEEYIFSKEERKNVIIIKIEGELRQNESIAFNDFVLNNQKDFLNICIDFSGVPYVDSMGVSILFRLFPSIVNKGGKIYSIDMNQNVFKLFKITQLTKYISVIDREELDNIFPL